LRVVAILTYFERLAKLAGHFFVLFGFCMRELNRNFGAGKLPPRRKTTGVRLRVGAAAGRVQMRVGCVKDFTV
jgi:hypothetical protein